MTSATLLRSGAALLLSAFSALSFLRPESAFAQACTEPPRLSISPLSCTVGEPCEVSIALEAGVAGVASVAATLATANPGEIECAAACAAGTSAPGAFCAINPATCAFNVAQLFPPITPFSDGPVGVIEARCLSEGSINLTLDGVSMGTAEGGVVPGPCGLGAQLQCNAPSECGNGILEPGEQCDGSDLGGATCTGLGFDQGTLSCDAACQLDTAGCSNFACGNGIIEPGEQCDGSDLGGSTCTGLGFDQGALSCDAACQLDTAGCSNFACGNGIIEPGEQCDGADLAGNTCSGLGFDSGALSCNASCAIDTNGCTVNTCGNGVLDPGEQCDDGNLADNDGCSGQCIVESSQCTSGPRLRVRPTTCTSGIPCPVAIELITDGVDVASAQAILRHGSALNCSSPCNAAEAATNGTCFINSTGCNFLVLDTTPPITSFGDGAVAMVTVGCDQEATIDIDLTRVVLADTTGAPIAGACGETGTVACVTPNLCGNGTIDPGEQCDDGNTIAGDCCSAICTYESAGTTCRAADGPCDVAETCTGSAGRCPADSVLEAGTICRPGNDPCDAIETCDGASTACPPDLRVPDGGTCPQGVCCEGQCTAAQDCFDCVALTIDSELECRSGETCSIPVGIDPGDRSVAAVTAEFTTADNTECDSPCTAGSAAAGASCDIVSAACRWQVADLIQPITNFATGRVAEIPVRCSDTGQNELCVRPLDAFATDGVTEHSVCAPVCATLSCVDCVPGDCNRNARNDSGDSVCIARCLTASEPAGADCSCGGDCNCTSGTEASDISCAIVRNLSGDLGPADPCTAGNFGLRVGEASATVEGSARLRVGRDRIRDGARTQRTVIALRGSAADDVSTLRTRIALDSGTLRRVRLTHRLRAAGFTLSLRMTDARHAVAVVIPPSTLPLPAIGKGRTLLIRSRLHSRGLAVSGSEYGSTGGLPVPGL